MLEEYLNRTTYETACAFMRSNIFFRGWFGSNIFDGCYIFLELSVSRCVDLIVD